MTTIKIGTKTLTVLDGADISIDEDAITVTPKAQYQHPIVPAIYPTWPQWKPPYETTWGPTK